MGSSSLEVETFAQKIGRIFTKSKLDHGCIVFENENGAQQKHGDCQPRPSHPINVLCDRLVEKNKHPAPIIARHQHAPFNLFDYEFATSDDYDVNAYFEALRTEGVDFAYFLPFRGAEGTLIATSVTGVKRALSSVELSLIYSYCLEKLDPHQASPATTVKKKGNILTRRERECLIAAGQGYTEKDTGRLFSISPNTVHAHIENAKRKLRVRNKLHAIITGLQTHEFFAADIVDASVNQSD